jgi:hypothetical protein
VSNAASNPKLVSDCDALLEARDTLAGDATLNWADSTSIATWDGVTLGGTPQRVTQLRCENKGLTGTIPIQLGRLTSLETLFLNNNQLTGAIPGELVNLTKLDSLYLADNALTGCIPAGLQDVATNDLETLNLLDCNQFDFYGNGKVDIEDLFSLFAANGSSAARFDLDGSGIVDFADILLFIDALNPTGQAKLVAKAQERIGLLDGPQLQQNAPNPFNSQTVLSYFLPEPGPVRVEILALTGQRVAVLSRGQQKAGYHRLSWDGRDDAGGSLASGVYLYRLVTTNGVLTRKLVLLR